MMSSFNSFCSNLSVPAKPKVPEVVESGEGAVNVTYKFDVGGGWTREFKVLYRKKGESYFLGFLQGFLQSVSFLKD